MTGARSGRAMRNGLRACALALIAVPSVVWADPWIPAAGTGKVKPMIRLSNGDRRFLTSRFTTATQPSSAETQTQFRVTGVHGLGGRLSVEYDFRGGILRSSKRKDHKDVVTDASGPQDQEIGLNYGLRQTPSFADSLTLNIVMPTGSTSSRPALGSGHLAIEPDYQVGTNFANGRAFSTLEIGARIFADGVATQARTYLNVGFKPLDCLTLVGSAFYVRTHPRPRPRSLPRDDRARP